MPQRPCLDCSRLIPLGTSRCAQCQQQHDIRRGRRRWHSGSTRAWRTQRERILARDGFRCTAILPTGLRCGVTHPLEIHHLQAGIDKVVPDHQLTTVCPQHHPKGTA